MTLQTIAATPTSPAPSTVHRPARNRSMTLVNLSSHVLRLVRIEGAVEADAMPRPGVLVGRGEQLDFTVARSPGRSVIAYLEVAGASGTDGVHQYPVTIVAGQSLRSNRAMSIPGGARGWPLAQLHLTQETIVLRNAAA